MRKVPLRILEDVLEQLSEKKFSYKSKGKVKRDWSAYNAAREDALPGVLLLIRSYVDFVELPEIRNREPGRPPEHSAKDKAKAVLLAELFQADERTASGLISLFKEKLLIKNEMSPRTIGRAYYDSEVHYILEKIVENSNQPIQGLATSFSGDSTGQPKNNKVNYARDKENEEKRKDFNMLSLMVSNQFHTISAWDVNPGPINDAPTLQPLFNQTLTLHPCMQKAQFDAGFLSRDNTQHIADHQVEPYIFPKKNITLKPKGKKAWNTMIWNCITNTQEWLRSYYERSNSETVNACLTLRFTKPIRRKHFKGQIGETLARICIHNLIQTHTNHYEHKTPLIVN